MSIAPTSSPRGSPQVCLEHSCSEDEALKVEKVQIASLPTLTRSETTRGKSYEDSLANKYTVSLVMTPETSQKRLNRYRFVRDDKYWIGRIAFKNHLKFIGYTVKGRPGPEPLLCGFAVIKEDWKPICLKLKLNPKSNEKLSAIFKNFKVNLEIPISSEECSVIDRDKVLDICKVLCSEGVIFGRGSRNSNVSTSEHRYIYQFLSHSLQKRAGEEFVLTVPVQMRYVEGVTLIPRHVKKIHESPEEIREVESAAFSKSFPLKPSETDVIPVQNKSPNLQLQPIDSHQFEALLRNA